MSTLTHVRPRTSAAAVLLTAILALTGCGGGSASDSAGDDTPDTSKTEPAESDDSVDDILDKASAAFQDADSVSVSGAATEDDTAFEIDLGYSGDDASGTLSIDGAALDLLSIGGTAYVRGSAEFWTTAAGDEAAAALLADKWIIASGDFEDFADFVSRESFISDTLEPEGDVTQGDDDTYEGVECITLDSTEGGTLYLAKDDGRPVALVDGESSSTLTFTYDDVEIPEAPAAEEILDPSTMGS